jgi:hypothetical protein
VETYLSIARKALDLSIVDASEKPVVQSFRMNLGKGVNPDPFPDKLILGANSVLLENSDFLVTQPVPLKSFEFEPLRMRTQFRFIEGYEGNSTVRGWRDFDSIYHAVFACVRGASGYPKGRAWETVPSGLLLRPAIPSRGLFGVDSTYGHKANFKVSLRELPVHGNFRVTVSAAKYDDGLLLDAGAKSQTQSEGQSLALSGPGTKRVVQIARSGIYQVDVFHGGSPPVGPPLLTLALGDRSFNGQLHQSAFLVLRLPAGQLDIVAHAGEQPLDRIVLTRLRDDSELAQKFAVFEDRAPRIGLHVGLRRDCGSTLAPVGVAQSVESTEFSEFVFEGAINNFPSPNVEQDNVNYLAGVRELGIRSEFTDGRDISRLLIRSVHFEGPLYETWPPIVHRRIFTNSEHSARAAEYAHEVIRTFAIRAFRRPLTDDEESSLFEVWQTEFDATDSFAHSIRSVLSVVLASPQFLFLVERSNTPDPEPLDAWELASKLSCFLWNTVPDNRLLGFAAANSLHGALNAEVERMISDQRFEQCTEQFVSQWLDLNRFDVVEVDHSRFSGLTPLVRAELRKEPVEFVQYLIRHNLPLQHLVRSEFILANEVVAAYYGLGDRLESGFHFEAVDCVGTGLGGILTQAGILAGLSNGKEPNPVRRGAWLARRIIAEPPEDPPPNVPALSEEQSGLSLREKLEQHRNQDGCAGCHSRIDPWGLPFEPYSAGGLLRQESVDGQSTLPDGTFIPDMAALKSYLAEDRIDQVAFSFLKHLSSYAVGRSLTYNEIEFLREHALELQRQEYPMRDMVQLIINSDLFLMK